MSVDRSPIYIADADIPSNSLLRARFIFGSIWWVYPTKNTEESIGRAKRKIKRNETVIEGLDFRINKEGVK